MAETILPLRIPTAGLQAIHRDLIYAEIFPLMDVHRYGFTAPLCTLYTRFQVLCLLWAYIVVQLPCFLLWMVHL